MLKVANISTASVLAEDWPSSCPAPIWAPGIGRPAASCYHCADVQQLERNVRRDTDESSAPKFGPQGAVTAGHAETLLAASAGALTASSDGSLCGLPMAFTPTRAEMGGTLQRRSLILGCLSRCPVTSKGSARSGKTRSKSSGKGQRPASGVAAAADPAAGGAEAQGQGLAAGPHGHDATVVIVRPPQVQGTGAAASAILQPISGLSQTGGVSTGGEGQPHVGGTTGGYIVSVGGAEADGKGRSTSRAPQGKGRGGGGA
jgi:hypothetical protein